MKPIYILLFLIFSLSACTGTNRDTELNQNFRTGTQGITLEYMTNAPQAKLYDDEPFLAMVKVWNRGASNIYVGSNSKVYLSGFDSSILVGISQSGTMMKDLEGKTMFNNEGEWDVLEFTGTLRDLGANKVDSYDFTLMATACYDYTTIAEPTVCIDPDPFSTTDTVKACNGDTDPSLGSQGAPVAISSVNVEPLRGRTKFKIYIDNVGGGTVFKNELLMQDRCSPYDGTGLEYTDVDVVKVIRVTVSNTDITGTCQSLDNGNLRLVDGHGYMICEITNLGGPAYTTPLMIQLDYGYRQQISTPVTIVATP